MVKENDTLKVEYADNKMFKYSPNVIKITRKINTVKVVSITVSDLIEPNSICFDLYFGVGAKENELAMNLSRALQVFGNYIEVRVSDGTNFVEFNIYTINGARNVGETYGGEYHIRRWGNMPFAVNFLYYSSTDVYQTFKRVTGIVASYSTDSEPAFELASFTPEARGDTIISAEGEVYRYEWETADWIYHIKEDCLKTDGTIYLRWIDIQGLTWYWLFRINEVSVKTKKDVSYGRVQGYEERPNNYWSSENSKTISKQLKIGTYDITAEEYNVVKGLLSSVLVDAYDFNTSEWYRVRVADGDYTEEKGHYRNFEIEIELPPINTQVP